MPVEGFVKKRVLQRVGDKPCEDSAPATPVKFQVCGVYDMMRITPAIPIKNKLLKYTYELEEGSKMLDMSLWALECIPYLRTKSGITRLGYIPDGMKSCPLWMGSSFGWGLGTLNSSC